MRDSVPTAISDSGLDDCSLDRGSHGRSIGSAAESRTSPEVEAQPTPDQEAGELFIGRPPSKLPFGLFVLFVLDKFG
jgi:hypothetical protein